jgi:8-oxo-dGTP diphosphatase
MTAPEGAPGFIGAKAAFFCGGRLLVYLRDEKPGLPWPGHWDLPGGGREGDEGPEECLLRELEEEFGLRLAPDRLLHRSIWPAMQGGQIPSFFFAGLLHPAEIAAIRFGDEGQGWQMTPVEAYLAHPLAVPAMVPRVRWAFAAMAGGLG